MRTYRGIASSAFRTALAVVFAAVLILVILPMALAAQESIN
jgi:hypothetical protein